MVNEANQKMAEWSSNCDQTVSCGTLVQYIEIEITQVQRRYDQFGNLIEETIRELKIKLQVTKDKEVSCVITWCPILVFRMSHIG